MSVLKGAPGGATTAQPWLPPLAVLSQTLLLLAVEGLSVGLALGFLLLKGSQDDYLGLNAIGSGARRFLLAMGFGVAAAVVAGGGWVAWRGRQDAEILRVLSHAARRLAPSGVAAFVPLLFQWRVWRDRDLAFLVLVGVAVLGLAIGLRVAGEAGPLAIEEPFWRSVRGMVAAGRARWPRLTKHLPLGSVCAGALGYALYFGYYTAAWHWSVRSGYDLALESNLVWNVLHGGPFFKTSPLVGPVGSHFGYHATLFAYVIAPIYFFWQHAETLLVLQSVLLGAAAIPLFLFARQYLSPGLSALLALGYLLYPPVHGANLYEFHYLPLGTFFLWTTLYLLETGRTRLAIVAVILTLSVREDVAASLSILGVYLVITGRRPRAGIVVAAVSAVYFVVMKLVVMPLFANGGGESFTFIFHQLLPPGENSFGAVLKTVIGNPAYTVATILEPGKLVYLLQILIPLAFIPLGRPLGALFLVPGFFFTLLSTAYSPAVSIHYQYTAHWTTFMFIAVVLALAVLPTVRRRAAAGAMMLGLVACSYQYGFILQTHISWGGPIPYKFEITNEDRIRRRSLDIVLKQLPADGKVSASGFVTPQISSRPDDYSMTLGIYDAEYILFPTERQDFIVDERQTVVGLLSSGAFGLVVAEPPFALARRGHPTDGNAALLARIQVRLQLVLRLTRVDQQDQSQKFDGYAQEYLALHQSSIESSGESPAYFAAYKLHCLERLDGVDFSQPILDFGCGIGMLTEQLVTRFTTVHGFDPSKESLALAAPRAPAATFHDEAAKIPDGHFALAVLSGVLHHIVPAERERVLKDVRSKLRPGGRIVVFEHNPLNPLTRRAVAQCPFDDDAILLGPREARRLLGQSGFENVRRDFIVFLPRALAKLRWMEPHLRLCPLGAQMMLVGARPA